MNKYSVRALLHLSIHSGDQHLLGVRKLSVSLEISKPMLSKVLQNLTKKGWITSKKGRNGGFYMKDSQKNNTLLNILRSEEQSQYILNGCLLGQKHCLDYTQCPYHQSVQSIRREFISIYGEKTIAQTAQELNKNVSQL